MTSPRGGRSGEKLHCGHCNLWNQLEGDAKEKEKVTAGPAVICSSFDWHHEKNMDIVKWLQLKEDAQEKEKMAESGKYNDWESDLGVGLGAG